MPPRPPIAMPFADFMINPQTNWARWFNPQLFISLNSGDAPLENHILSRVGSYGHQLGALLDVADVFAARLPAEALTDAERAAIEDLRRLRDEVEAAKAEFRGESVEDPVTPAEVDRLLDQLDGMRRSDPDGHRQLTDRIRQALDDGDDAGTA